MVSKKIFTIDAIFNLPDDFEGDWREALMLFAKYVQEKKNSGASFEKIDKSLYEALFSNDSVKHASKVTIQEWNGTTWSNKL